MDGGCKCQVAKCTRLSFSPSLSHSFPFSSLASFPAIYLSLSPSLSHLFSHFEVMLPAFDKYALAECLPSLVRRETTWKDQAAADEFSERKSLDQESSSSSCTGCPLIGWLPSALLMIRIPGLEKVTGCGSRAFSLSIANFTNKTVTSGKIQCAGIGSFGTR